MAKGAHVPLVSSFMLSTKEERKAWVEVVRDPAAPDGWRFEVRLGKLSAHEEAAKKLGTKSGKAQDFLCVLTSTPIARSYIQAEGKADRLSERLMAIVGEGTRGRVYLAPSQEHEQSAASVKESPQVREARETFLNGATPTRAMITGGVCSAYGLRTWGHLFTPRQLVALTTFSDLVGEARERVLADARKVGFLPDDDRPLAEGGTGPVAYADAVATYLTMGVSRLTDICNALCRWESSKTQVRNLFGRQAIPMVWDFAEPNVFADAAGDFYVSLGNLTKVIDITYPAGHGHCRQIDAPQNSYDPVPTIISTDPPYYDNVGYADLSDFFYVWLRRSLREVWPDLFRRLTTPKDEELVATPYRHGGKEAAERFFMEGMRRALRAMREAACDDVPLTLFYAFKQSENGTDGITSAGWASFLQAVVDCGLIVDGTWPLRTELANRMIGREANVLASSIVLVCRKRPAEAPTATRAELLRALRRELPGAVLAIREAGVGPVDMQQAVIGPGMGVFSRYARVLEDDDTPMSVKTALALVNRVWEEIENELDTSLDAPTQVALAWYADKGFDSRSAGELVTLANAKDTSLDALFAAGVFENLKGRVALVPRERLPEAWRPSTDRRLTVWECVQHTIRALHAEQGGFDAAAELVRDMPPSVREAARALSYRLFELARRRGLTAEAQAYNELAELWPKLEARADELASAPRVL